MEFAFIMDFNMIIEEHDYVKVTRTTGYRQAERLLGFSRPH